MNNFVAANRAVVNAFEGRGKGGGPQRANSPPPQPRFSGKGARADSGGKGGKGGKGRKGGKGDSGGADSGRGVPVAPRTVTLSRGQFDDADFGTSSEMMDDLIDATFDAPDGILVFDYVGTEEEQNSAAAKFDQANPRSLPELLQYSSLATALGEAEAKTAPAEAADAWGIASGNPYITHDQRVEIAGFVDEAMRGLGQQENGMSLLEYALTPPDDYRPNY